MYIYVLYIMLTFSVLRTDVTQLQVEDGVLHAVDNILSQQDVLLQHEDQVHLSFWKSVYIFKI